MGHCSLNGEGHVCALLHNLGERGIEALERQTCYNWPIYLLDWTDVAVVNNFIGIHTIVGCDIRVRVFLEQLANPNLAHGEFSPNVCRPVPQTMKSLLMICLLEIIHRLDKGALGVAIQMGSSHMQRVKVWVEPSHVLDTEEAEVSTEAGPLARVR